MRTDGSIRVRLAKHCSEYSSTSSVFVAGWLFIGESDQQMAETQETLENNQFTGNLLEVDREPNERSSVDDVYDQILLRIIRGELVSGEVLICMRLAEELNVSRTPVVSAVDRLVSDGILIKEKNRRARVKDSAETWLLQIHQLRELVEPPAAKLAAQYMPDEVIAKLVEYADSATPGLSDNWLQSARDFDFVLHRTIADYCRNMALRETIYKCWKFKTLSYELGCSNPELEEIGHREHLAILAALSQHDPETAHAAMMFHLRSSLNVTTIRQVV